MGKRVLIGAKETVTPLSIPHNFPWDFFPLSPQSLSPSAAELIFSLFTLYPPPFPFNDFHLWPPCCLIRKRSSSSSCPTYTHR